MKYKIGDVSRILGISTDLLRYYEKKGVVAPEKNKSNDYRYYDVWDINYLLDCLWFKNFGFSIEQTAEMVRTRDVRLLGESFEAKEAQLRESIRRGELLLRRSVQYRADLSRIDTLLGVCEISESPEMVQYINRFGDEYSISDGRDCATKWLEVMPFNRRYFEIFGEGRDDYRWGFSLDASYAAELGFEATPPMRTIPARKAVHTVFRSNGGKGGFDAKLPEYMREYARAQGRSGEGMIYGVLLASVAEDRPTGYFEAWLPIE